MCGIAGIVGFGDRCVPTESQIRTMCDQMVHRGPDDYGADVQRNVAIGMRRLSIIDLSGGHQPIFNEDRTIRTVFNGEIYNFGELRRDLEAKGHRFATRTDTEVIVHAWEEYGPAFVNMLNGMFAIALHDMRQNRFLLARDHLGIKPLFYAVSKDGLVFGSEVKVVLASGMVERELDIDQLGQYLAWEYIPGEGTLIKSIRKLKPAHLMEVDLSPQQKDGPRHSIRPYWDIPAASNGRATESAEHWAAATDEKIRQCVQRQLISDVPLGAFLSGGVDSSLVVAGMGPDAKTFSIGFDDPTYNELSWAQRVAEHLGVAHTYEIIEPHVVDLFDHLMNFMDDPIGDFSIFPTYLVSRHARKYVTVALSGDGGDELFGGYETFLAQQKARQWQRVPAFMRKGLFEPIIRSLKPREAKKGLINKARRFVEGLEHPDGLGHARWRLFVGEGMRRQLFTPDALGAMSTSSDQHIVDLVEQSGDRNECDTGLYVDVKSYLVDNCLVKVDRMSMACSLETRVPLLDKELAELAFTVPADLKVSGGATKVLLKQIAAQHVPRECVYRPKEGFSIPIKTWLKTDFRAIMDELLDAKALASEGIFNVGAVERIKREHLDNRANHSHILWSMIVFQDWRKRWNV